MFQFWTARIQKKSELISSEIELISADVYHVLWISAEKRQNYETALFSADYLWDFNPGMNQSSDPRSRQKNQHHKKTLSAGCW